MATVASGASAGNGPIEGQVEDRMMERRFRLDAAHDGRMSASPSGDGEWPIEAEHCDRTRIRGTVDSLL
jgi:hypothetical protein